MRTPIMQFGTSRFLQAHADLFFSETGAGPVTVVQTTADPTRARRLAALPQGFDIRIQGLESGRPVERVTRVTSVARALSMADWPEVRRIFVEEAEIVLSNTSEAGWHAHPADTGAFDPEASFPAKLTHLLRARWQAGGAPLQIMPTELIVQNGSRLRARVLALAEPALADWIRSEVRFVNSLVDRIVSAPLDPAGAVAEPYALWAIEDQPGLILPCLHPAVKLYPDLTVPERLKLHILNLGHTFLVAHWPGRPDFVRQLLPSPALEALYAEEVLPVFAQAGIAEAPAYAASVIERFSNPFLDHRLADIAQNHAEKVRRRIGDFLLWAEALGAPGPFPRLKSVPDRLAL